MHRISSNVSVAYVEQQSYNSVVNMSKSCCFAFVLAVICLSLEADAQPTVDETTACSSTTLEDVAKVIRDTNTDVKKLLASSQQCDSCTANNPKQTLVSALECEFLICFQ